MRDPLKIADDFLSKGQYIKAIEFATKSLEDNPSDSKAFEILGIAKYRLRDASSSLECLFKSIELNPKNDNSYYILSLIYGQKSEWQNALDYIDKALQINRHNTNYLYCKAFALYSLCQFDESMSYCSQILNSKPGHQEALFLRADIYLKSKQYALAIEDYKKLDYKTERKGVIYNNIGFCYSMLGDVAKAKINLQFAIELNSSLSYAYNNLGFVYYLEKNYQRALNLINESLGIDSSNSFALKNRALVLFELNQIDQAIEDLLLAKDLGYAETYDNEVDLLLEKYKK